MKKVLLSGAALALAFGMASTASAVDFKIKGDYTVEGVYQSDAAGNGMVLAETAGTDNMSDSFYMHTFRILPTMKVNDKVTMQAEIRLADNEVWGTGQNAFGGANTTTYTTSALSTVTINDSDKSDVYVHRLYMDWMSPMGKVRVGRAPSGPFGPAYMNNDSRMDRIMWWPNWLSKPWGLLFFTGKVTENDQVAANASSSTTDYDRYEGRVMYKTANTDAVLRYVNLNNNASNADNEKSILSGYYNRSFGNGVKLSTEIQANFGSKTATVDYDSWAGIVELSKDYGNWSPSIMYFYAEGNDPNSIDDEAALGTGGTGTYFTPLVVMTGKTTGMLNNDTNSANTGAMSAAGVHGLVLATDYKMSDRMTLHGALGWAEADEVQTAGQDDEYGFEINVGAAYKLLDNLTYEAHFGYLDTGDFFDTDGAAAAVSAENVYVVTNSLTMTF